MTELIDPRRATDADSPAIMPRELVVRLPVARARQVIQIIAKPVLLSLGAIIVWAFTSWFLDGQSSRHLADRVFLPLAMLSLVCVIAARHEFFWTRPIARLLKLLPQIRAGERPIEELSTLRGGAERIVPALQELLHDLRQQKVELAELNAEIRQRLQQRTDALERTIGSLRQQATRDALTGLCNRRMLDGSLPQIVESCRADGSDLCILMIDVDHFKQLNDTLGHAAGDELLRDIGQLIRSTIRTRDMGFRFGGDEFTIVMPGATEEAATALSDRLISLVDARAKTLKLSPRPRLSVGLARLSNLTANATPHDLIREADKRLYEVKSHRRSAAR